MSIFSKLKQITVKSVEKTSQKPEEKIPMAVPKKEEPKRNFLEISCPYCDSKNFVKRGTRKKKNEVVQLYLCSDCKKTFTPGAAKGKHYPMGVILDAMSLYYLGYSLEEACKISNRIGNANKSDVETQFIASKNNVASKKQEDALKCVSTSVGLQASTLNSWLEQYKPLCAYARMRQFAVKMMPAKEVISSATLAHRQLYRFRHHRAKTILIIEEDWKHSRFWPLKDFLDLVPVECPHQYFQRPTADIDSSSESKGQNTTSLAGQILRASEAPITFSKTEMIVRGKNNFANKMAKFVLESVEQSKDRHDALQRFMLANDTVTVATEVPVYLRREDLLHMKTQLGFKLYKKSKFQNPCLAGRQANVKSNPKSKIQNEELKNKKEKELEEFSADDLPRLITGHIDFVQVRNGQIHILDYKPNAAKERPIEQLTIYALALSRLTGLKVFNFKCAWFDEKDYFEFYPLHVVYKKSRKRRTQKVGTIEGVYEINKNPRKVEKIRADK